MSRTRRTPLPIWLLGLFATAACKQTDPAASQTKSSVGSDSSATTVSVNAPGSASSAATGEAASEKTKSGPPSTFIAFSGELSSADRGRFVFAIERSGDKFSGRYFEPARGRDVPIEGEIHGDHFTLTASKANGDRWEGEMTNAEMRGRWRHGKEGKEETQFVAHENRPFADNQTNVESNYVGFIGDRLRVRAHVKKNGGVLNGEYRYASSNDGLELRGNVETETGRFELTERDENARTTASIRGVFIAPELLFGRWLSADGSRSLPLVLSQTAQYPKAVSLPRGLKIVPREQFQEPGGDCTISVLYPQVVGFDGGDSVNRELHDMAVVDEPLSKETCKGASHERRYYSDTTYEIGSRTQRIIGIRFASEAYAGGAHGSHQVRCIALDSQAGKVFRLGDKLTSEGKTKLGRLVTAALRKLHSVEKLSEAGFFVDEIAIKDPPTICLDNSGPAIVFQEYEIAPYAMGQVQVNLDVRDVAPLFEPEIASKLTK